jgi:glutamine amidotransferase
MSRIVVIDYQMGNLRSVAKGLEAAGAGEVLVSGRPEDAASADKLVLPGVGAFRDAIAHLREAHLVEPVLRFIQSGRPFLGICLGLQLLFERSYEDGVYEGLGVLGGQVVRFDFRNDGFHDSRLKVPHIGWNQIHKMGDVPMLAGVERAAGVAEGEPVHVYFVHSYYVVPTEPKVVATTTKYGVPFCSSVQAGALYASQFHPEKSQAVGLQILRNFVAM